MELVFHDFPISVVAVWTGLRKESVDVKCKCGVVWWFVFGSPELVLDLKSG